MDKWWDLTCNATKSIEIFANELSWIKSGEENLKTPIRKKIRMSLICRIPNTNTEEQSVIGSLLKMGVQVKFFSDNLLGLHNTLLVDIDDKSQGFAIDIIENTDAHSYHTSRYVLQREEKYLEMLSELFRLMWHFSREGVILKPLDQNDDLMEIVLDLLRLVKQYINISRSNIRIENVEIRNIFSSSAYVKLPSLQSVSSICQVFREQDISEYDPCYCLTNRKRFLLLPPILEDHGGKLVVVDGTHRLFYLYTEQQRSTARCLILNNTPELPGEPVPFTNIKLWPNPEKLPRESNFINYKPDLYRSFREFEKGLETVVSMD